MSYFNIDTILMEEERIPCVFVEEAIGMGVLDPSTEGEDLPAGSKVELPLWLARAMQSRRAVQIQQPMCYGEHFREQLFAGAGALDLREANPYYYQVGGVVSRMMGDTDLETLLLDTFVGERFKKLLQCSLNSAQIDIAAYTRTLPAAERRLFDAGYDTNDEYIRWKSRENLLLKASRLADDGEKSSKRPRHS